MLRTLFILRKSRELRDTLDKMRKEYAYLRKVMMNENNKVHHLRAIGRMIIDFKNRWDIIYIDKLGMKEAIELNNAYKEMEIALNHEYHVNLIKRLIINTYDD